MTSKSSFCDAGLLRESLRRNLWAFTVALLGLFCALPLPIIMTIQHGAERISLGVSAAKVHTETLSTLQHFIGTDNALAKFVVLMLAIMCGFSSFSYLHSRQQIDFYHSLPVRRGTLFGTNYVVGIVTVLPLYLLMTAAAAAIVSGSGYREVLGLVPAGIATDIVFYLALYTLAVLCTILCGNRIITVLLLLWVLFSAPAAIGLCSGLCDAFYASYASPSSLTTLLMSRLSPVTQYFSVMQDLATQGYNTFGSTTHTSLPALLLGYLAGTAVLLALSYVLFLRRKSERAGSAIAFQGLKTPLKLWCVAVMALAVGVMLHSIDTSGHFTWLYFGFAFGGILTHFLMEIIYAFDFKAIFSHLKTLAIFALVFVAVIVGMKLDVTGFNHRLPAESDLQGVQITAYGSVFSCTADWKDKSLQDPDNIKAVLQLADYGREHNLAPQTETDSSTDSNLDLNVTFLRKSGLITSRHYLISQKNADSLSDLLQQVSYSQEYLSKCLPIYTFTLTGHDLLMVHTGQSEDYGALQSTDPETIGKIVSTLRRETLSVTPVMAKTEVPVAALELNTYDPEQYTPKLGSGESYYYTASSGYIPIYPSFTETLALLRETMHVTPLQTTLTDVKSIHLQLYTNTETHTTSGSGLLVNESVSSASTLSKEVSITDPADIAALIKAANPLDVFGCGYYTPQNNTHITFSGVDYSFTVDAATASTNFSLTYTKENLPTAILQKYLP